MGKFLLKGYQKQLIPSFSAYNIDPQKTVNDDEMHDGEFYEQKRHDSLAGFDPIDNQVDALIWSQITRERITMQLGGIEEPPAPRSMHKKEFSLNYDSGDKFNVDETAERLLDGTKRLGSFLKKESILAKDLIKKESQNAKNFIKRESTIFNQQKTKVKDESDDEEEMDK